MKLPKNILAQAVLKLCIEKRLEHIVISPGSRNAPLVIGFTNHSFFKCFSIVDERCAAFFALGMAKNLNKPTVLVCTSGSALLNYYPAIAEAYYSDVPLVVLSADRPEHLIGIGDGQTINQENVFTHHINYQTNLKEESDPKEQSLSDEPKIMQSLENRLERFLGIQKTIREHNQNEINKSINLAIIQKGPVHINIPFDEPLYETVDHFLVKPIIINNSKEIEFNTNLSKFHKRWNGASKKMILVGANPHQTVQNEILNKLANDDSIIVFTETTSNLHHIHFFQSIDKIIAPLEEDELRALQPEILVTFGGLIVSKKIKSFLRKYQPKQHWHIDPKKSNDTFFCLSSHFKCTVDTFFSNLFGFENDLKIASRYNQTWQNIRVKREEKHNEYMRTIPFSDMMAFQVLSAVIPKHYSVHSSNSSVIRYMQLFNWDAALHMSCNRGTSGIDGSTSTALGAAVASNNAIVLITGDLSFFYDSNALWNNYIPENFRIIVINNEGGGIFRIISNQKENPYFETYIETTHKYTARHLCNMYHIEYLSVNDDKELNGVFMNFFASTKKPKLLEIITPRTVNDEVLLKYFKFIK